MNQEKLKELIQNEEFVKQLASLNNKEEIREAFKARGLELSMEELGELESAGKKALEDGELENVSGGKFSAEQAYETSFKATTMTSMGFAAGIILPKYAINDGINQIFSARNKNDLGKGIGYTAGALMVFGAITATGIAIGKRLARNSKDKKILPQSDD